MNKVNFSKKQRLPHDLNLVMGGWKNTGKSSLIRFLRGQSIETTAASTGAEEFEFETFGKTFFIKKKAQLIDRPGEMDKLFEKIIAKAQPHGIIFMVDHENIENHRLGLERFATFINTKGLFRRKNRRAGYRLSSVLILVNKMDLWQHQFLSNGVMNPNYLNLSELEGKLRNGMQILQNNGIKVLIHKCSLLTGNNVDGAVVSFLMSIIKNR